MSKTNYFQLHKLGEEEWDIGLICLNDLEERYSERKNSYSGNNDSIWAGAELSQQ